MADWEIALDKQLASWLFYTGDRGQRYLDGYAADVETKYPEEAVTRVTRRLMKAIPRMLWNAEPIYVTPPMLNLLDAAWPNYLPEPLYEDDLIVPTGFVYLPRPIFTVDVWGKRIAHRAIAWHPAGGPEKRGIILATFADPADLDDYNQDEGSAARFFGQASALGYVTTKWFGDDPLDPTTLDLPDLYPPDFQERATREIEGFHGALFRLLNQRIAVGLRSRPSRGLRRRMEVARYAEKYVTVVTLRRPASPPAEESHQVEWSQRWIVSGHWHWYHTKNGPKQLWVAPYVKGPEDKPLMIRGARVFRLAR